MVGCIGQEDDCARYSEFLIPFVYSRPRVTSGRAVVDEHSGEALSPGLPGFHSLV